MDDMDDVVSERSRTVVSDVSTILISQGVTTPIGYSHPLTCLFDYIYSFVIFEEKLPSLVIMVTI